jgi:hypothetical protein
MHAVYALLVPSSTQAASTCLEYVAVATISDKYSSVHSYVVKSWAVHMSHLLRSGQ